MAKLFGRDWTRKELLRYVGDLSQVTGVRSVRLQDGPEDGVRTLEFRTGSGLQFDVLADRGFDISSASHLARPLAWRSGAFDQHPAYFDPHGAGWLRTFYGGLVVTCGLSQVGAPNEDNGQALGAHGRISATPAREVSVRQFWDGDDYILEARAKMREVVIFGENLLLERTISTSLGSNTIRISDTVINEGFRTVPHMLLYHINLGYPVISDHSQILLNAKSSVPRDADAETEADKCLEMLPPQQDFRERCYFHDIIPTEDGLATVAMINPDLDGKPFGVAVRYTPATLNRFTEWKMMGEGDYVCGLEPANCSVLGRAKEREAGTLVHLNPLESVSYEVEISVIDSDAELSIVRSQIGG